MGLLSNQMRAGAAGAASLAAVAGPLAIGIGAAFLLSELFA